VAPDGGDEPDKKNLIWEGAATPRLAALRAALHPSIQLADSILGIKSKASSSERPVMRRF
jgi:hypothetical protein